MLIGITGGIGTGKSYIVKILNSKGYKVIESDLITRKLLERGQLNYPLVVAAFGEEILDENKEIIRSTLKKLILASEEKRLLLNQLTHPNIMAAIKKEADEYLALEDNKGIVFVELPLLYEENLESYFDEVWLIDCSKEEQLKRVIERDKISRLEAQQIMDRQLPRAEKLKRATVVIPNSIAEENSLVKRVEVILAKLKNKIERDVSDG